MPDWNSPGEELDVETTWSSPEEGRTKIDSTYHDAETGEWQGGAGSEGPSQPLDSAESSYRNRDGTTTQVRRNADGFTQSTTTDADGNVSSIDTVKPDGSGHTDTFDAQGNRTSSKDYGPGER